MVLTQKITRVYKESLILKYPPNINIWLELQFWYPQVRFVDTIIDVDH